MDTGLAMGPLRNLTGSVAAKGPLTVRLGRVIRSERPAAGRRWAGPSLRPNALERQTGELEKLGK